MEGKPSTLVSIAFVGGPADSKEGSSPLADALNAPKLLLGLPLGRMQDLRGQTVTINIAVVSRDALVLGCDSIASVTKAVVEPWGFYDRDEHGNIVRDEQGRAMARIPTNTHEWVVTDARGGATKMFELSRTKAKVAATTAGMAALSGRSIHSLAMQFFRESEVAGGYSTVEEVANRFSEFMAARYDEHYAATETPEVFRTDIEFLVGGYGENDHFPSLFRLHANPKSCAEIYGVSQSGIAWAGQADGVNRLIFGSDSSLKYRFQEQVDQQIDDMHKAFSEATARILANTLEKLGAELPADVDTTLPNKPTLIFPWPEYQLDIEVADLPLQDAVDLVSYLVNLQAGRAKFVRGVATVGGRTRVGVITRSDSFRMLNEPEIVHRSTGYQLDV